jgi:hypothetical protein
MERVNSLVEYCTCEGNGVLQNGLTGPAQDFFPDPFLGTRTTALGTYNGARDPRVLQTLIRFAF